LIIKNLFPIQIIKTLLIILQYRNILVLVPIIGRGNSMLFSPQPKERREDLFDRDKELNSFYRFIDKGGPICLILGLRRTGKSSLLKVGLNTLDTPYIILDLRKD